MTSKQITSGLFSNEAKYGYDKDDKIALRHDKSDKRITSIAVLRAKNGYDHTPVSPAGVSLEFRGPSTRLRHRVKTRRPPRTCLKNDILLCQGPMGWSGMPGQWEARTIFLDR